jgi:hypothetical protein
VVDKVANSVTITCYPSLVVKAPKVPENRLQQVRVGARWDAVHCVVTAHHRANLGVTHTCLEGREIVGAEVLLRDDGVEGGAVISLPVLNVVPRRKRFRNVIVASLRKGLPRKVLAVRGDLKQRRVNPALQTINETENIFRNSQRVFPRRFLTSAPARVAEG